MTTKNSTVSKALKSKSSGRPSAAASRKRKVVQRLLPADYLKTAADRATYLSASLAAGDTGALTVGIRDLSDAVGGVAGLASSTGLSRETLYRTLTTGGNPRLDTLSKLLRALGLRLTVQAA